MARPLSKPYTVRGIRRVPCARCGNPSTQSWQICADGNRWRGLCTDCDILLNALVLGWIRDPERAAKMQRYVEKMARKYGGKRSE